MATIDPSIALGVKPIQIEDPINRFARQQELSVNMLKGQETQQAIQDRNMLRQLDPSAKDYIQQVGRINPKLALDLQKGQLDTKKLMLETEAAYMKNARNTLAPIQDQATYDIWRQQTSAQLPGLAQFLPAKFDNNVKTSLMLEADKYIQQTQISEFQKQDLGIKREGQRLQYDPTTQANIAGAKKREEGKVAQEIQGKIDVKANRKALATAGYDPVTGKDNISKLIQDSTGSFIGAGTDLAGRVFGVSTKGAQSIAELKAFESKLTQDILGGKLGAGISNTDREFIVQAIGDIANQTLPVETRQAAWNSVKERMRVAGMVEAPQANLGANINTPGGGNAPANKPSLESIFAPAKK